jgi:hypothetical protein
MERTRQCAHRRASILVAAELLDLADVAVLELDRQLGLGLVTKAEHVASDGGAEPGARRL